MPDPRAIGVFGGTFDPIHFGHLRLAEEARLQLGLDQVRLIPTGQPWHRGGPQAPGEHRLAMARLAATGNPHFAIDPAEVEAAAPGYTVVTLQRLRAELGDDLPLVLLVGADAFVGLPGWHRWRELFALAHVAVAHRPGFAIESTRLPPELAREYDGRRIAPGADFSARPAGSILTFAMTQLAISATQIRRLLAAGESPRYLLPESVITYIAEHNLYRRT